MFIQLALFLAHVFSTKEIKGFLLLLMFSIVFPNKNTNYFKCHQPENSMKALYIHCDKDFIKFEQKLNLKSYWLTFKQVAIRLAGHTRANSICEIFSLVITYYRAQITLFL